MGDKLGEVWKIMAVIIFIVAVFAMVLTNTVNWGKEAKGKIDGLKTEIETLGK